MHKCLCKNCLVCKSLDADPETAIAPPGSGSKNAAFVNIIVIIYPSGEEPAKSFWKGKNKGKKAWKMIWHMGQIHHGQFSSIATARNVQAVLAFTLYQLPLIQTCTMEKNVF